MHSEIISDGPPVSSSPHESGPFPASASQQRLWFLHRFDAGSPVYNMPRVWRVAGPLNMDVLADAIATLIARHESLRTNVAFKDGILVQIVAPPPISHLPLVDLNGRSDAEREMERIVDEHVRRPFDLEHDLLLRTCLVRMKRDEHVLVLVIHHLASDRWSSSIFHRELGRLYESFSSGSASDLEELPIQYSTYSEREREYLESDEARSSLDYWTTHLAEVPLLLNLPCDRPRPAIQAHKGAQHSFSIPEDLVDKMRGLSRRERVTLSTTLLAAFETLLFRSSQQTSFVIGVPVAGRSRSEFEGLVGNFVNTLPLRVDLSVDPSFAKLLRDTGRTMIDALDHQDIPVERVIEAVRPERSLSYAPVFQVMFNFTNTIEVGFQAVNLTVSRMDVHNRASMQDLALYVAADGKRLECTFEYDVDLFDAATIDRFGDRFLTLIESAVGNPDLPVSKLEWIPASEQATLSKWNSTTHPFPSNSGVHQLIEERGRQTPDKIAVACDGQSLTYKQLDDRANRAANFLLGLGAGRDSRIAIAMERSVDMVVGLLAVLKTGAAYVPLDFSQPRVRVQSIVDDSAPSVVLTHERVAAAIDLSGCRLVLLETAIQKGSSDLPSAHASGADPAYLVYTSGTTGKPKGVIVPHSAVVNILESMHHRPGLTEADTLLAITPLSFDIAGLEIFLPLYAGARLEIASRPTALDPVVLSQKLVNSKATIMQATPATWRMLVESNWRGNSTLSAWCGGEALPKDLADRILDRVGSMWNLYGPTETTIWSTVSKVERGDGAPPIGAPIANTKLHVLDAKLQPLPIDVPGELYISGAGLAHGCWQQPELTDDRFPRNPFEPGTRMYKTGDLVRWRASGTLEYLGRLDNQVKIRGFRIELGEVEATLGRHQAVSQCVVVARESALVAYFESSDGSEPDISDLRTHLKKELPEYMLPASFVRMERLPLTPNGKIDRKALPEPEHGEIEGRSDLTEPRDPLEQALARAWSKVLKLKRVGLNDNFFDIGGNSLAAVHLLSEVQKLTDRRLPLATLFQASTVQAFAELLRRDGWMPSWSSLVPIQPLGSKCPLFLVHGAEGNVLLYRQVTKYLGPDQPVYGLQSRGLNGDGCFHKTISEMASHYVREIMTVQPQGPYFLGGYCLGGIVAFEMAQQLSAMGEKTELVLMLDSYNLGRSPRSSLLAPVRLLQNVWFHGANAFCVRASDRKKFLVEKMDIARRRLGIRIEGAFHFLQRLFGRKTHSSYPHLIVKKSNDRAAFHYQPRPYAGRVALIRSNAYFLGRGNPSLGWSEIAPNGLEIHKLPVYPKGMLIEPFCQSLADTVKLCLRIG